MVRRVHAIAAIAACAVISLGALPALAGTYDFSADATAGVVTPATIGLATFSSPSDPGAYTFGPNGGLFSALGPYVLSSGGATATLDIAFAANQHAVTFDFALGDFLASGGGDVLTVTTNTGVVLPVTAGLRGSDFYPEASVSLSGAGSFSSLAISSPYPIVLADLTSVSVPEPASMTLLGGGLLALMATRRRRS